MNESTSNDIPLTETDALLNIKDDNEFEAALAAYTGEGDRDYMRVTRKRILDADRAYKLIEEAIDKLANALNTIAEANTGTTRTRALSLGATKIEEAIHWIDTVSYIIAPHDMNSTDPLGSVD